MRVQKFEKRRRTWEYCIITHKSLYTVSWVHHSQKLNTCTYLPQFQRWSSWKAPSWTSSCREWSLREESWESHLHQRGRECEGFREFPALLCCVLINRDCFSQQARLCRAHGVKSVDARIISFHNAYFPTAMTGRQPAMTAESCHEAFVICELSARSSWWWICSTLLWRILRVLHLLY